MAYVGTYRALLAGGVSRPALVLDFIGLNVLDPRITFTRGSNATRVNSSGLIETVSNDVARFDYDPVTLAAKGLLIEEQRTNLLTYSERFDNAAWVKFGATVVANATIAPDGTGTADALIEDTTTGFHNTNAASTTYSAGTYTASVYVKAAGRSWVLLTGVSGNLFFCYFNLTGSGAAGTAGSGTTSSIAPVGNGWYRVSVTKTFSSAFTGNPASIVIATADNTAIYTGNGTSGIYIWGAQLEAGAFATSYIPTVASTVTRSADVATMTGSNFSAWYNQAEGSFVAAADSAGSGTRVIVAVDDNTANENIELYTSTLDPKFLVTDGGVAQADIDAGLITANTAFKLAAAYKVNDFAASIGGGAAVADTSGTLPTVDRLRLGVNQAGNYLGGHLRSIAYFNTRLPNAQLQSLTA